jgi:radical SAM superfamily enzyme with C-terminal helix-hairpin-helix motif
MTIAILDCYTDEPSGLGVPPYIGTYPRYLAGRIIEETGTIPYYLTIDDLRSHNQKSEMKTDIKTYNRTRPTKETKKILDDISELYIIIGVHTPGKYLSAVPGTIREVFPLVKDIKAKKIMTGPVVFGSQLEGGRRTERIPQGFDVLPLEDPFTLIKNQSIKGANIIDQINGLRIAEIETGRGCSRKSGCTFCLEPVKHCVEYRDNKDIVAEVKELVKHGITNFRLGKQSCFYSLPDPIGLLKSIRSIPEVDILHIDNVNPAKVTTKEGIEITKALVKYGSDGNVAAFGVESFDPEVIRSNNLNSSPETVKKAIRILNEIGGEIGPRGLPKFLPGINILFGLIDETKDTHKHNIEALHWVIEQGYMLRRINVRKVVPFDGTPLAKTGRKFLKKNGKYYWKWREEIRQTVDNPLLKALAPIGTELKEVMTEIHDGKTTFGRQIGTYPLIIGMPGRHELKEFHTIKVIGHMKRSIVGEIID